MSITNPTRSAIAGCLDAATRTYVEVMEDGKRIGTMDSDDFMKDVARLSGKRIAFVAEAVDVYNAQKKSEGLKARMIVEKQVRGKWQPVGRIMDGAQSLDPRIGTLNSGRFYAFANGYDQPAVEGTRAEVERALGITPTSEVSPAVIAKDAAKKRTLKDFEVTCTPRENQKAWNDHEYKQIVMAKDRNEAIKKAREKHVENNGPSKYETTYDFKARVVRE
jgi:hypothetical protein